LSTEEGGNLEGIDDRANAGALLGCVDVSNGLETIFGFNGLKDLHASIEPGSPVAIDGCAVGFIERAFKEYVQLRVLLLERCQCIGDGAASIEAFKRTGPCEKK
jgi:hypothetical protein